VSAKKRRTHRFSSVTIDVMDDMTSVADELRIEFYRKRIHLYQLAPAVRLHPARIGELLNGKRPLTPELAERIRTAIRDVGTHSA
jgi:plasmid maintenance system antidote protein VapI